MDQENDVIQKFGHPIKSVGFAKVFFCDPEISIGPSSGWYPTRGCGMFAFFKPERNSVSKCPNCGIGPAVFVDTGDIVRMEIVER